MIFDPRNESKRIILTRINDFIGKNLIRRIMVISKSTFYVHISLHARNASINTIGRFMIRLESVNKIDRLTRLVAAPVELYLKNI